MKSLIKFKEGYLTYDSLLTLSSYKDLNFFKNLKQKARESMNSHFSKIYTLYRLSALLQYKEEMQTFLRDLLRMRINKETIAKYEKPLSKHLIVPKIPTSLSL